MPRREEEERSMTRELNRRTLLKAAAGTAGLTALSGLPAFAQTNTRVRVYWWGSKERADRTLKAAALYQQRHPEVKIDGETLGWGDYWQRLATQAAGRNAPDLIQMDYRYIAEYARRGALLPLDEYLGKSLEIADFGKESLDSCRVDGKLYAVNLGNNSNALIYNKAAFQKAGVPEPENVNWEKFAELAAAVTKAHNGEYYGTSDASGEENALENWIRQRGKALFTEDGKLALDEKDAGDWFVMWAKMRETKACPPADLQALDKNNIETNLLTQGRAACAFNHSNQYVGYQVLNKNPLGIAMYPQGAGPKHGHYLKPSQMWSVYSRSKVPEEAVKIANFTVKDPEGAKILGVERGVPASPAIREVVGADLDDMGKKVVDFISFVTTRVGPLPPAPPQGAGEVQVMLRRVSEQVGFGKISPTEGGKQYVSEAKAILARA
jgi:multiple sugar transport system substrate-binding protein